MREILSIYLIKINWKSLMDAFFIYLLRVSEKSFMTFLMTT